jgi:hypothetical protein
MAEVATSNGVAGKKPELIKPEKPDEDVYKASLKKAEKEHQDSMAKFVCNGKILCLSQAPTLEICPALQKTLLTVLCHLTECYQSQIGSH